MAQGSHKMKWTMNVEQVVQHADEPFFDDFYSPKNWFRSADAMLKQASIYEHEGDFQTAYFLLYRHAKLILEFLPKHPDAKNPQYRQSWLSARKSLQRSLAKLEVLKPRINKRFERHQEKVRAAVGISPNDPAGSHIVAHASAPQLDPSENVDVAVRLANHRFGGLVHPAPPQENNEPAEAFVDVRRRIDQTEIFHASKASPTSPTSRAAFNYPEVGRLKQASYSTPPRTSSIAQDERAKAPLVPPKLQHEPELSPPTSTAKESRLSKNGAVPSIRSSTPDDEARSFAPAAFLEDGTSLRTVFLPQRLRSQFLSLAAANTMHNLETLGLLCGTLVRNAFFVTHLVLPPQTATSDTCEMTEAGEMLLDEFISAHSAPDVEPDSIAATELAAGRGGPPNFNLLTLGWIHTHPTQTCFLSSRDLHTHVWYQASLPEAVAIVCAPRQAPPGDWGGFRLTDPPGMRIVRNCNRPGIFHPHDEFTGGRGIYTDVVGRPGHVIEGDMPVDVVDLRSHAS